jgi:hypothetical protein
MSSSTSLAWRPCSPPLDTLSQHMPHLVSGGLAERAVYDPEAIQQPSTATQGILAKFVIVRLCPQRVDEAHRPSPAEFGTKPWWVRIGPA